MRIHCTYVGCKYSEFSLIHHNSFLKMWLINKFGGLTGYSLLIVEYVGTGKLCWMKRFGR